MPLAVVESSESVAVTCITDEPVERERSLAGDEENQVETEIAARKTNEAEMDTGPFYVPGCE